MKVKRVHQEITEQTMQTEHDFFSEQDMIDAGWNEKLGFTKCHSLIIHSISLRCFNASSIVLEPKEEDHWCQSLLHCSQRVHNDWNLASMYSV